MARTVRLLSKAVIGLFTASALVGCISVLPEADPAPARFLLSPAPVSESGPSIDASLTIADPSATRALATTSIALMRSPGVVEYYRGGEWSDRAPALMRTALLRSFENSGRILSVGDSVSMPAGAYTLRTDIRSFHIAFGDAGPRAEVSVYARLTNRRGRVLAAKLFDHSRPLKKDAVDLAGAMLNDSAGEALASIVDWSLATIAEDSAGGS
ncbi:MAG: ABC-type transport auxiliary lipoprotein family protein [Pseudomonadota bacterium]